MWVARLELIQGKRNGEYFVKVRYRKDTLRGVFYVIWIINFSILCM